MYEEFDTLEQVHARLTKRLFGNFVVNNTPTRTTQFSTSNKKYILQTKEPKPDVKPKVNNNCKEVKNIGEINSLISSSDKITWHIVIPKSTGSYILLWGTHRM